MGVRSIGARVGGVAVVAVAATVAVGALFGQPLLLGFVETGSMQPSLAPGDGFVALPPALVGGVGVGDVVTFRAEQLNGGGLVTHRVVGVTDEGFITRGDANPVRDQAGDEPPVKRAQVVAVALQVDGDVVALPHLGTAVSAATSAVRGVQGTLARVTGFSSFLGVRGLAYLLFALSLVWYAVGAWRGGQAGRERRETARETGHSTRLAVAGLAALVVLAATASMALPAGTQEYEVVSAEFDSEGARVIPMGESETTTHPVGNGGVLPTVVYLEPASEGVTVQPRETYLDGGDRANATVTLQAPPETGLYRRFVAEHRYLALLPRSVIRSLHGLHPWAPVLAIDALLGVPFYVLGVSLVGRGRVRTTTRDGPSALRRALTRLKP
jgi:signal peptidase